MLKKRCKSGTKYLAMARAVQRNEVPPLRLGFSSFINVKLLEKFRDGYERMFSGCVIQLLSGDPLLCLQRLDVRTVDCAINFRYL